MKPTLYLATDHAGFELKNILADYLRDELKYEVIDCGAHALVSDDDYPDFIKTAAEAVSQSPTNRKAVILGGSGQGEAMLANRFPGVRAAVYYGGVPEIPALSRKHNDANILSLGARFLDKEQAKQAVESWLKTDPLTDEKYQRRIEKIDAITDNIR